MTEINDNNTEYPRILVVSNNSFSDTKNNGKTLASFFKGIPTEKIAQLYFNSEIPTDTDYSNYFRITDSEVVKSCISKKHPGQVVKSDKELNNMNMSQKKGMASKLKGYEIARIFRELFWLKKTWKTKELSQWLVEFSPQIIFLCAGDSGFAYDIAEDIRERFQTKTIIYITDDYILPRKTISPFWWIRRNLIYNKMKIAVQKSNMFITISEEMRKEYKTLFGVDSTLAMNMTGSMKDNEKTVGDNDPITLVYAGGLHFKRYKTLELLAKAIVEYNLQSKGKKALLEIYSGSPPSESVRKYLNYEGASQYAGSLTQEELKVVLNRCDIAVHVESFNPKSIESTRLSISTKIPEYLSLGKPVLAVGPEEVASIRYLQDCAYCITDSDKINNGLRGILDDDKLRKKLSDESLKKYDKYHNPDIIGKSFKQQILMIN